MNDTAPAAAARYRELLMARSGADRGAHPRDARAGKPVIIERIPYPADMPRGDVLQQSEEAREAGRWVASRLAVHGLGITDPWDLSEVGIRLPASDAYALHGTLVDIVHRVTSLDIGPGSSVGVHMGRRALMGAGDGILRALTKNPAPLDGEVFAQFFEWPGYLGGGAIELYLWYAPMQTLRSIDRWLHEVVGSSGVSVEDRTFLLRALGRLDARACIATARAFIVESPWATSEALGMFGGPSELALMRSKLPEVARREEARTRRHYEAGMRKLERRLSRT